jgi:hypothetical protein
MLNRRFKPESSVWAEWNRQHDRLVAKLRQAADDRVVPPREPPAHTEVPAPRKRVQNRADRVTL